MWEVNMEKIDLLITLTAHENDANNVTIAFTMGMNAADKGYNTVILLNIFPKSFKSEKVVNPSFLSKSIKVSFSSME